jgi:hypothetical protein
MSDVACPINLGPRETKKRLVGGVVGLAAGLVLGVLAIALGLGLWVRLAAVGAVLFGVLGLLQARAKT